MSATFAESITVEALEADPYPIYARLRREQPAAFVPAVNVWMLTRWADVEHAGSHPDLFSAETPTSPVDLTFGSPTVLTCDGDVHKELRSSIDPKFRPRAVDTYVDALIEPIAEQRLARFAGRGSAELMAEYFEPISVLGLGQVLGLADVDGDTLRRWFAGTRPGRDELRVRSGEAGDRRRRGGRDPVAPRPAARPPRARARRLGDLAHAACRPAGRRSPPARARAAEPARDPARRHAGARARRRLGVRGAARTSGPGRRGRCRSRRHSWRRPSTRGCV